MGTIEVNVTACKGCLLCAEACPKQLLKQSSDVNAKGFFPVEFIDAENPEDALCTGCTFCALVCPDVAIKVFR
jgi:2-oxoglutarate ferredoxin oxidoreductase subunit delta